MAGIKFPPDQLWWRGGVGLPGFSSAPPAPFTPADLSPALWIDPSDASTVTISGSSGAYIGPNGLMRGGPNSYAYAAGVPTFTGPVEIEATFTLDSLPAVGTLVNIVHRGTNLPSLMDWAYGVVIDSNGFLVFRAFMGGSIRVVSATGTAVTTGVKQRWKITADPNVAGDLQVTFYLHDGSSFVQTAQITQTIGTTTFAALVNRAVNVGGYGGGGSGSAVWDGSIARVIIRDGIAGTTIYDADFENATPYVTVFTESALGVPVYVVSSTAASSTANYSYVGPNGLTLAGSGANFASAPDIAAYDVTAEAEIVVRAALNDWTPAAVCSLVSHINGSTGLRLDVHTDGTLKLITDAATSTSTVATGFTDGTSYWLKATYSDAANEVKFWWAADASSEPGSWTQLGTTVAQASALSASTSTLNVGAAASASQVCAGTIRRAILRSTIGGTTVFDADFTTAPDYVTSFTESSSNAATVTITATNTPANAAGALVAQIDDKSGNLRHLTQGTAANMPKYWNGRNGNNCLVFDGTNDYLTSGAFTLNTPFTMFNVLHLRSGSRLFSSLSNDFQVLADGGRKFSMYSGSVVAVTTAEPSGFAHSEFVFNGASSKYYRDGTLDASPSPGADPGMTSGISFGAIGSPAGGSPVSMISAELAFVGSDDSTERTSMETYIRTKWGTP